MIDMDEILSPILLLEQIPSNPKMDVFFNDILQYKYISQNPVVVVQFRGFELEKPFFTHLAEQKGVVDISFFYFSRSINTSSTEGVVDFCEAIRAIEGLVVQSLKPFSHKKNVSIWEIKAQLVKVI